MMLPSKRANCFGLLAICVCLIVSLTLVNALVEPGQRDKLNAMRFARRSPDSMAPNFSGRSMDGDWSEIDEFDARDLDEYDGEGEYDRRDLDGEEDDEWEDEYERRDLDDDDDDYDDDYERRDADDDDDDDDDYERRDEDDDYDEENLVRRKQHRHQYDC